MTTTTNQDVPEVSRNPGVADQPKPNGAAGTHHHREAAPATSALDDIDAAADMPNVDDRKSVLNELPNDLFVEDRESFAVEEVEVKADKVAFKKPSSQENVRCHPDLERKRVVWCLKDARNNRGALYVITPSMLKQHPRLTNQAKKYQLREFVNSVGDYGVWAVPLPGYREATSDPSAREAQDLALKNWVRVEWNGKSFTTYVISDADGYGEPVFPDRSFDEVLRIALAGSLITDANHPLCQHLLKGEPVSSPAREAP